MNQVSLSPLSPGMSFFSFELKLYEEAEEVYQELKQLEPADVNYEPLLSEIFDVMQTCYTFMIGNFSVDEISEANKTHLEKMERKYA